jgi:tetratricopeptide (TPR) repeat protein
VLKNLNSELIAIQEKSNSADPASLASSLTVLARLYSARGDYAKAERFFDQALAEDYKVFTETHPRVAIILNYQAQCYAAQGKYDLAEKIALRANTNLQQAWGPTNWRLATNFNTLATTYVWPEKV